MNRRLDGAFQGQELFTDVQPLNIFALITKFRRACDASGLTHGQSLPLLGFLLAGPAKRALASAMNSISSRKRFTIVTYGDAVNWLLAKDATHASMTHSYQHIIAMKKHDTETRSAFGLRVERSCGQLDGLFHAQDVKDVFINGLDVSILSHVRVLDGQFRKRSLADTVSDAQL